MTAPVESVTVPLMDARSVWLQLKRDNKAKTIIAAMAMILDHLLLVILLTSSPLTVRVSPLSGRQRTDSKSSLNFHRGGSRFPPSLRTSAADPASVNAISLSSLEKETFRT